MKVGFIDMLAVGMLLKISLHCLNSVGLLSHAPVDRINFVDSYQFVWRVGMLLYILLQGTLRTTHNGVGPVLVNLLEQ